MKNRTTQAVILRAAYTVRLCFLLEYSCFRLTLVAQMAKNPPAMQETQV